MIQKRWKRLAAGTFITFAALGMIGCGNARKNMDGSASAPYDAQDAAEAMGRYIETMKNVPEQVSSIEQMVRLSDGGIAFIDPDSGDLCSSSDGGDSWETKECKSLKEKLDADHTEVTTMAPAPDGGVFFSYVDWSAPNNSSNEENPIKISEHYIYIDPDGNDSEITLKDETGIHDYYFSNALFTGETTLLAKANGSGICQIDLSEGTIRPIEALKGSDSDEAGFTGLETIFMIEDYLLSSDMIFQISAKKTIDDPVLCDFIKKNLSGYGQMAFCFDSSENKLYSASAQGLYSHVLGGSVMEKILSPDLCNLGDPTKTAASVLKNEDDSFLIAYEDGEIDQYAYDRNVPAVPQKQLSIYCLKQNPTISKAISMFRKSRPDIYVKQEIGLSGDYGITEEDAIRNLNTKLLAGEGPDLLLLDQLPMDSYIEKGVLADLGGEIESLEKESHYFSNILKAFETSQGLYAIPFRYDIPVLYGGAASIQNVSGIKGLKEAVRKARAGHENAKTILGTYTAEELLKRLLLSASPSFSKQDKLDPEAIKTFLESAKEIYEEEQKNLTDEMKQTHSEALAWKEENGMGEDGEIFSVSLIPLFDILAGMQVFGIGNLNSMTDFQMAESLSENKEGCSYEIYSAEEGNFFIPRGIIGLNEKSDAKEMAAEFLKELLGEEVQKTDLDAGFPVNADAYASFAKNPKPDAVVGFSSAVVNDDGSSSERVDFDASWPAETAIADIKEKIETLTIPSLPDGVIPAAVLESGIKVLEGDLSIEEGCSEIVQKASLYLAE